MTIRNLLLAASAAALLGAAPAQAAKLPGHVVGFASGPGGESTQVTTTVVRPHSLWLLVTGHTDDLDVTVECKRSYDDSARRELTFKRPGLYRLPVTMPGASCTVDAHAFQWSLEPSAMRLEVRAS